MPQPKSLKKKIQAVGHYFASEDSYSASCRKIRAREFEEHSSRYLKRKYGSRNVEDQKPSRTSKKRPDHLVNDE